MFIFFLLNEYHFFLFLKVPRTLPYHPFTTHTHTQTHTHTHTLSLSLSPFPGKHFKIVW